jgi:cyanophycinase
MTAGQRTRWVVLAAAVWTTAACAGTRAPSSPTDAVPKGHLLIVGGGPIPDPILARFVELAGGRGRARIVIFPMASEYADAGVELAEDFRKRGAEAERVVLTH